jgi:two-component system chemotaxis response regulator CheB
VVIGASAGGVEALRALAASLPPEFPAAIVVALHVASAGTSVLPQILARNGPLPAAFAHDGESLRRGHIHVAPPDFHCLIQDGRIQLSHGPPESGHRPAIDPLFRSAAAAGPRVIGVILSGMLDDGAGGLRAIKEQGGAAVVQDPDEATFPAMPLAAIAASTPDLIVGIGAMASALYELIDGPADRPVGSAVAAARPVAG